MSNAKDTAPAVPAAIVPEKLLDEGEIVILAIKPSAWHVLLESFPAVAAAVAVGLIAFGLGSSYNLIIAPRIVMLLCMAAALARVLVCCFQWVGRLYVLTNVRIMRVRGVVRADVFQCPLRQIRQVNLTASAPERMLSVASLYFDVQDCQAAETAWLHIAQPAEVYEIVSDAIRRARPS